jgi:F0F1-type ATP synthase assembly protein I
MKEKNPLSRPNTFTSQLGQVFGQVTEISSNLVGPVIAGALAGYFLDRWLHTRFYLTLALVFVGFLGGLFLTLRNLSRQEKKNGG